MFRETTDNNNIFLLAVIPGVDPNEVKVTHLTAGQFTESSDGGSFSVPISWEKPIFNYSTLVFYTFRYKIGSKNSTEELMVRNFVLKTLRLNKYLLKLAPLYRLLA